MCWAIVYIQHFDGYEMTTAIAFTVNCGALPALTRRETWIGLILIPVYKAG
jgi:hypothetical protein